mgnify:CR=1 FL=1
MKREKRSAEVLVSLDELAVKVNEELVKMQADMLARAKAHLAENIHSAADYDTFKDIVANKTGFVKTMWCGDQACEDKIKEEAGCTSRCMPFEQKELSHKCICCGKPAKKMVYWGKAY